MKQPDERALIIIVAFTAICILIALSANYSTATTNSRLATLSPTAWAYLPYISKQIPTPTMTPVPTLHDGYYKCTTDYGSFWFTMTDGGIKAIDGGYDFQRPSCSRAERDFAHPANMRSTGTFYFDESTLEGDPIAYLDINSILSSTQGHGCVADFTLGLDRPYYCGYMCGIATLQ